jgi:hypothetical protein
MKILALLRLRLRLKKKKKDLRLNEIMRGLNKVFWVGFLEFLMFPLSRIAFG